MQKHSVTSNATYCKTLLKHMFLLKGVLLTYKHLSSYICEKLFGLFVMKIVWLSKNFENDMTLIQAANSK